MISNNQALWFLLSASPAVFADGIEADRRVELTWDNPMFDGRTAVVEARLGGEKFYRGSGERCFVLGAKPWVITDIHLQSQNPDPNREQQFPGSHGVSVHYTDGGVRDLVQIEPHGDQPQLHATPLSGGLVIPPHSSLCFNGWDGSSGYANRTALRAGRVLGYVPED